MSFQTLCAVEKERVHFKNTHFPFYILSILCSTDESNTDLTNMRVSKPMPVCIFGLTMVSLNAVIAVQTFGVGSFF